MSRVTLRNHDKKSSLLETLPVHYIIHALTLILKPARHLHLLLVSSLSFTSFYVLYQWSDFPVFFVKIHHPLSLSICQFDIPVPSSTIMPPPNTGIFEIRTLLPWGKGMEAEGRRLIWRLERMVGVCFQSSSFSMEHGSIKWTTANLKSILGDARPLILW